MDHLSWLGTWRCSSAGNGSPLFLRSGSSSLSHRTRSCNSKESPLANFELLACGLHLGLEHTPLGSDIVPSTPLDFLRLHGTSEKHYLLCVRQRVILGMNQLANCPIGLGPGLVLLPNTSLRPSRTSSIGDSSLECAIFYSSSSVVGSDSTRENTTTKVCFKQFPWNPRSAFF